MNSFEKRAFTLCLIIALALGVSIGYTQTPPGQNTIEHGEGINFPTITATDGYYYGATNITDRLFGDFGILPLTGGAITGTSLATAGNVIGGNYYIGVNEVTNHLTASLVEPASFIGYRTGATYYVKSGTTGQIVYSGGTGATVLQDALNALSTAGGGILYLARGEYGLGTTTLLLPSLCSIKGEGIQSTSITYTGTGYAIETTTAGAFSYYNKLSDFRLTGNANGEGGIHLLRSLYGRIDNVLVQTFTNGIGISIDANTTECDWNHLYQVRVYNCLTGISFTATTGRANENQIFGGRIHSVTTGIHIHRGYHNDIYAMDISTGTTAYLIEDLYNHISSPYIEGHTVGFNINSNYNMILGGTITATATPVIDTGANNVYTYVYGFVNENIGTETILNGTTSIIIAHGLSYTPTSGNTAWTVTYLENPTNDPGSWWINSFNATHATIHVFRDPGASHLDIAWSARRTP